MQNPSIRGWGRGARPTAAGVGEALTGAHLVVRGDGGRATAACTHRGPLCHLCPSPPPPPPLPLAPPRPDSPEAEGAGWGDQPGRAMQGLLGGLFGGGKAPAGGEGAAPVRMRVSLASVLAGHARDCASASDLAKLLRHWTQLLEPKEAAPALSFEEDRGTLGTDAEVGGSNGAADDSEAPFLDVLLCSGAVEEVCRRCIVDGEARVAILRHEVEGSGAQGGEEESLLELLDCVLQRTLVERGNSVLSTFVGLVGGVQEVHEAGGGQRQIAESVAKGVGQLVADVIQFLKKEMVDHRLEAIDAWDAEIAQKAAELGGEPPAAPCKDGEVSAGGDGDAKHSEVLARNTNLLRLVERATKYADESRTQGNSAFIRGNLWSEERDQQVKQLQLDLGNLATCSRSEEQKVELEARKTAAQTENEAKTLTVTVSTLKEKKSELEGEYKKLAVEKMKIAKKMEKLSKQITEVDHQMSLIQQEEMGHRESIERSVSQAVEAKSAAEALGRQHVVTHDTMVRLREIVTVARDLRVSSAEALMMKASSVSATSAKTRLELIEGRLRLHLAALGRLNQRRRHLAEALEPLEAKHADMMAAGMADVVEELLPSYRKVRDAHEKVLRDIADVQGDLNGLVVEDGWSGHGLVSLDGAALGGLAGGVEGQRRRIDELRDRLRHLLAEVGPE